MRELTEPLFVLFGFLELSESTIATELDRLRGHVDAELEQLVEIGEPRPSVPDPPLRDNDDPGEHLITESNEAEWGFTR